MRHLLAFAIVVMLSACSPPHATSSGSASMTVAAQGASQPAPYYNSIDYRISPDSRERLCDDSRLANRNDSFATLTKASNGYCF